MRDRSSNDPHAVRKGARQPHNSLQGLQDHASMTFTSGIRLATTVIRPTRGWSSLRLKDLWEYRDLLYFLTWREIKVRYKQTAIGATWAIIQPLFTMLVFSLF